MFVKIKKGFTITEAIVVIIVFALLGSVALPRFLIYMEGIKSKEGRDILFPIYKSEMEYALDNNGQRTDEIGKLDVNIPSSVNFDAPQLYLKNATVVIFGTGHTDIVASIRRTTGEYTLFIKEDSSFLCEDSGNNLCGRMGY